MTKGLSKYEADPPICIPAYDIHIHFHAAAEVIIALKYIFAEVGMPYDDLNNKNETG